MKKKNNPNIPTSFLQKTFEILSEPTLAAIVAWADTGTEFIIYNQSEFTEKVLPMYFKHNNFSSFIRQLNMYDFHKLRSAGQEHIYKHPLFLKNRQDLLKDIRRKVAEPNWPVVAKNSFSKPEMAPVIKKIVQMHQTNVNYHNQIIELEEKVQDLTKRNKILADEVWENKDRMKNIEKALIYFASCIKGGGSSEEMKKHFPAFDNILPIADYPEKYLRKKRKIEGNESEMHSPLELSEFEDELILSPKPKTHDFHSDIFESKFEDSVDIEKLDFLLDQ